MLTKVLALVLVVLIGLALGIETARYVHVHATGVDASGVVNIHHALGFGLLATSGALLLSLSREWLSRQWTRFTVWLELTLDGLFDFDALLPGEMVMALTEKVLDSLVPVVDDAKRLLVPVEINRRRRISRERLANPFVELTQKANVGLLSCRGCSWCGVDPGDLPDELWTECDGSGRYLPSSEAERQRQLAQAASSPLPRRHPEVLSLQGDVLFRRAGTMPLIVRRKG